MKQSQINIKGLGNFIEKVLKKGNINAVKFEKESKECNMTQKNFINMCVSFVMNDCFKRYPKHRLPFPLIPAHSLQLLPSFFQQKEKMKAYLLKQTLPCTTTLLKMPP